MLLDVGDVIRMFVEDVSPPKVKYCIVVGKTSQEVATIFINSRLRFADLEELQGLQCPLSVSDCPFLKYDSYADCSDIRERDKGELIQSFKKIQEETKSQYLQIS